MGNPIIEAATLEALRRGPESPIRGSVTGVGYTARIFCVRGATAALFVGIIDYP